MALSSGRVTDTMDNPEGVTSTTIPGLLIVKGPTRDDDRDTFSAGEGFAYSLQQLKRAIIVGETTRGGAHPGGDSSLQPIHAHFTAGVPTARAINPITRSNWERVGVAPDIPVDREHSLAVA